MGLYAQNWELDNFLRKYNQIDKQNQKVRALNARDFDMLQNYRKLYKEMNVLIAELFTILTILNAPSNPDLGYIIVNLTRVRNSLAKQRNLSWCIKCAISVLQPDEKEYAGITRFLTTTATRMAYIRETVIPANLELTPIHEYLEICHRKDLQEDLYSWFGDIKSIVAADKGEDAGAMDKYVAHILSVVRAAKKLDAYETRIREYIRQQQEKSQKIRQEKAAQKQEKMTEIAMDGLLNFQRMFNEGVFTLNGDSRIKMGSSTVKEKISKYGRDCFFVLCCYSYHNHYVYRYLDANDQLVVSFAKACPFISEAVAAQAMMHMASVHPDKVFDTVELSHIEKD